MLCVEPIVCGMMHRLYDQFLILHIFLLKHNTHTNIPIVLYLPSFYSFNNSLTLPAISKLLYEIVFHPPFLRSIQLNLSGQIEHLQIRLLEYKAKSLLQIGQAL